MKIAYPVELFDRNIIDGRAMIASFLTLTIGNNQGMGDVEYGKMHDFYVPPAYLHLFDGPSTTIKDLWRVLGRPVVNGGFIVGTIIKPKLGLRPKPFADACYDFWLGGDFIKNDEPQGNQVFAPFKETVRAGQRRHDRAPRTRPAKPSCSRSTSPPTTITKCWRAANISWKPSARTPTMSPSWSMAMSPGPPRSPRRAALFPKQYLHYHRAGHGAVTSPNSKRGYTAFVLSKMARLQGASGIHTGTMGFGKMEGEAADKAMAYMITDDSADGPFYHQEWLGMNPTTPIISGGMNALRMPGFFENLGHSNLIMTAGGGAFGHIDGGAAGAHIAATGRAMLETGRRSDGIRQRPSRIRPRLRKLPA